MMNNEHEDPPVDGGYTGLSRNAPPSAERWPHRAPTDETEVLRQRLLDYGDANVKMQARVTELEAEQARLVRQSADNHSRVRELEAELELERLCIEVVTERCRKAEARVRELEAELSDISRAVKVIRDECDADVSSAESEARALRERLTAFKRSSVELVAQRDTALGACNGLREKIERMNFKDEWKKKRAAGYDYGREALEQVKFGFEIALEALRG